MRRRIEAVMAELTMPRITSGHVTSGHGAVRLPAVEVDSYNLEVTYEEGFLGDRASKSAFLEIVERWRKPLRKLNDDPFGETPSEEINRETLDALLAKGDPKAAGVLHGAIEDFAQELAVVIRRFLKLKSWSDTERIVVGGGFRRNRVGELVIGRAGVILRADKVPIDLRPIHHDPDAAGLIGAAHLAPRRLFGHCDAILAVDIGGTNLRAGVVTHNLKKAADLSKASVWKFEIWRHAEDKRTTRESAVEKLVKMLEGLIARASRDKLHLAPFIGIGCPGHIGEDGTIDRGAQNLPGNWDSKSFNLPACLRQRIPCVGKDAPAIVLHNDAVVQGLSEVPFMADVKRWGALTIGTGLGNARFTNRSPAG
jgi:predicted NBD/HSP70 family sugar kinase